MATKIYVPATVFATAPWNAYDTRRTKLKFYVGSGDKYNNLNAATVGASYAGAQPDEAHALLQISVNPVTFDDVQASRWPQLFKNELAALVAKALVVVESPVGVALTPAAIRAL